jgi:hypothetical protein
MLDHIYPYLLVHKKLQLAGIGTLEMVPVSAAIDPGGLHISAPYEKINFTPAQEATSSSFIAWVAAIDHIDMETASSTTHAAIEELAASIQLKQSVLIAKRALVFHLQRMSLCIPFRKRFRYQLVYSGHLKKVYCIKHSHYLLWILIGGLLPFYFLPLGQLPSSIII